MKKSGVLVGTALVCAIFLSAALVVMGLDKFNYILAGGKKFATFPDLASQLGIGLSYLALAILYLVWFFETKPPYPSRFSQVLKGAAVFLLLGFLAYPLGNDIYLYLHDGLMNLSGFNPFVTRAGWVVTELAPFVDWGQTSTYGPLSQLLFTLSALVIPIHPILAIYAFKAICLGLHVLNGYLIWQLVPEADRGKVSIAYLVNPLLLMEQVGSGHVDVLVSTSLIVAFGCMIQQRYTSSVAALWGGFLSKTLPIIWAPLVAVFLMRQGRLGHLIASVLLSLYLVVALSLTMLPGFGAWQSLLNPGVAGQSQSSLLSLAKFGLDLVRIFSPESLSLAQHRLLLLKLSQFMLVGFAGFYGLTLLNLIRKREYGESDLIEDMGWVTLVLLLVATPWIMPWYASVPLTIAALIPRAKLFGFTSLLFGLSSSAQYALYGHSALKACLSIGLPLLGLAIGARLLSPRSCRSSEAEAV